MTREPVKIPECEHPMWSGRHAAGMLSGPCSPESSMELLRTIAQALDIRSVFPRVSEIAKQVLAHDALALGFSDHYGHATLEARSTDDLPLCTCSANGNDEFRIVADFRRWSGDTIVDPNSIDALVSAGYRSALTVRCDALSQVMRLGFFSKQPHAYGPHDVAAAQHIAGYVAVAVAHEQLAAAERDRAEARGRAERGAARVRTLTAVVEALPVHGQVLGRSDAWQRVLTWALRVGPTETTVFLQGESGTGKEVLARFIHQASPRTDGPFVAINCAALPEQLLESELFGYERGAFTGAQQAKAGQIELAARGVLFLDEVSEMSLAAQAKFLRVLQEREFQRLGGTRLQKANVRVIAATNRDLREAVQQGRFREDLFYRLQVFDIVLPPLRDRLSDVPLLAEGFLEELAATAGPPRARLTEEAREALLAYSWPGNIRELRNALERAVILSDDGVIEPRHLALTRPGARAEAAHDLPTLERQAIERMLAQTDGNKSKAARRLGLSRTQLRVRLRRYGITEPEKV